MAHNQTSERNLRVAQLTTKATHAKPQITAQLTGSVIRWIISGWVGELRAALHLGLWRSFARKPRYHASAKIPRSHALRKGAELGGFRRGIGIRGVAGPFKQIL
jgi:hypothetical protein